MSDYSLGFKLVAFFMFYVYVHCTVGIKVRNTTSMKVLIGYY